MGKGEVRLFIASPTYNASYCSEYVESLVGTIKDLQSNGIKTAYKSLCGMHWIDIARDVLAHIFLHSDCTHMLQIDSDVGWPADAPRKMLAADKDIIGGVYPIKMDAFEHYPVKVTDKVEGLPGGFMLVKREVIERMAVARKPYSVCVMEYGELKVAPLYTRERREDSYTGEDFMFCRRAIESGYELTIYEDIDFSHVGAKAWKANYSKRAK